MTETIPLVVHATHEAGVKVGGIGAVLDGLLSAPSYCAGVERTVLVGPMMAWDSTHMERLLEPRNKLSIRYGSLQGVFDGVAPQQRAALQIVEQTYGVAILYGTRYFGDFEHEVILVDVSNPNPEQVDRFKYFVWQHYGIDSGRYGWSEELNHYFAIAQPLVAALGALGIGADLPQDEKFIIAHEWLGMPVVFAAQTTQPQQWRTIFYAHEMATARWLVEEHSGHDTRFYNALFKAREWGVDLDAVFGNQDEFFKHPIIRQATRCDNIFAVGDLVVDELRFLGGAFSTANIDLVYNGIPSGATTVREKLESKERLQTYAQNLLGERPDYIFTHVTRMVPSKALWRDLRVLEHLDELLRARSQLAVLFVLSTSVPAGRRSEWVHVWEEQYGWPVGHRSDNGDLIDAEVPYFFHDVEPFNARSSQIRVVFVNQFGWSQARCGRRMPAEMEFIDIRRGSDLEFGQSIYEPFGIAQVEPLSHGALCCVSNVCGCVGFVGRAAHRLENARNLVVANYVQLPEEHILHSPWDALSIDGGTRGWLEGVNSRAVAQTLIERLPQTEADLQALLERGQAIASGMSWDVVVQEYLLSGLHRARTG